MLTPKITHTPSEVDSNTKSTIIKPTQQITLKPGQSLQDYNTGTSDILKGLGENHKKDFDKHCS